MHSVIVNGKKYSAEDNAPLKELLSDAGFSFPCGGSGRCGKCRIVCPSVSPTDTDRRFLSEGQLSSGVRLACDKTVEQSLSVECDLPARKPGITLRECGIAVVITDDEIGISIVGDKAEETVTLVNPLRAYPDFRSLLSAYASDGAALTRALRGAIGRESVEFFERYGAAKAETTAVAAKEIYLKILAGLPADADEALILSASESETFDLPTESVYFLPRIDRLIGGEVLAECIRLKERSLVIDCERTVSFVYIGEKDNLAGAIWDCDYSEFALECIRAAALFLSKDRPKPMVCLYGSHAYRAEEALCGDFTCVHRDKLPSSTADALLSFRTRARLTKERNRTTFVRLYDKEEFQSLLLDAPKYRL